MKKNNKINVIIIIVVTLLVLFFSLKDDFLEKVKYLFSFNPWWLLLGVVFVVLYWALKALVIYYCVRKFDNKYSFTKSFKLMLDTQFVNSITPFSTGGQPYQIYRLKQQGFSLEKGTNIVIQDFVVYQISLILLGTIAIIANYCFNIFPDDSLLKKLVLLGYIINCGVIIVLFIVAFNRKGNKIILDFAIKVGAKLRIIKDKEKFLNKSAASIEEFHRSASVLMQSKMHFIKIIIINFFALVFLYLVPFTLIMGLGETIDPMITIITSAYVMLIGSFVPIPGGSGGIEFGFVQFFGVFITGAKLSSIMIAWRILTYYLGMIVGAVAMMAHKEE